jgi:hypothetical protein
MPIRAAHGRAKRYGAIRVNETTPADELPFAVESSLPVAPVRDEHGHFIKGHQAAKGKRRRPHRHAATMKELEAKADPNWVAARKWGKKAAAHRIGEYAQFHGGELSSGIGAMLSEACEMRADAIYVRARAMLDNNIDMLRTAAIISAGARQSERDAWELAVREAAARKANRKAPDQSPLIGALGEEAPCEKS